MQRKQHHHIDNNGINHVEMLPIELIIEISSFMDESSKFMMFISSKGLYKEEGNHGITSK